MKYNYPNSKMKPQQGQQNWILFALFSLFALFLVAVGWEFYRYQAQAIRQDKTNQLRSIAELKINQLVQWRHERLSDAHLYSSNPFLNQAVRNWVAEPGDMGLKADIETSLQLLMDQYGYQNVLLTTAEGELLLSAGPSAKEVNSDTQLLIAQSAATGEPQFGNFYHSAPTNQIRLDIVAALYDVEQQPVAALILRVDPENYLYPLIQSWPTPSQSAETLLIRRDGDDVLFLNSLRHNEADPLTLRIPISNAEIPAVKAVLGQTGQFEGIDYRGVDVLAEIWPVPETPWFMVAKVDSEEILAEVRFLGGAVLLFVSLSVVMTAALAAYNFNHRQRVLYQNLLRTEQERLQAQEEIRMTLYSIGDAVITTDKKGKVTRANPIAENLTGWSEAEAVGRPLPEVFRIINEESRSEVENPVDRVLREGQIVGLANHTLLLARDGSELPIADSGAPILGANGEINGVVLVFRDQSQERAALRELALLNHTISTSLNEIYLFDAETLRFRFANNGALENLGYSLDELRSMTVVDIKPEFALETFQNLIQPLLAHEKKVLVFETVHQRADGSQYPVEVYLQLFEHENEQAFLAVIDDITERRIAETEIRESEIRYRNLFFHSPDAIFVNQDDRVVLVNDACLKLFGAQTDDELIGKTPYDLFHPNDYEQIRKRIQHMRNKREAVPVVEETIVRLDGQPVVVDVLAAPFSFHGASGIHVILRDITQRKQLETALQDYHELLTRLAEQVPGVVYQYRLFPDGSSCFPYASPGMEEIYEVTPEEVREDATPVFGRLHPDDYDAIVNAIQESARTLGLFKIEFRVVLPRQGLRWRMSHAKPERTEDGGTLWYGIISDITDRKMAEFKIQEQLDELHRWHQATLGRENRVLELKQEVNKLLAEAGKLPRYSSPQEGSARD